jgi:hypothetical protein
MTYSLKEESYMTVITAYHVCKQHEPGPKTAYMQQHTIPYADEDIRPFIIDPHRQTIIDLENFVQEMKDKENHIIIFIDANEDEQHQFQEQVNVIQLVTKNGFHVDGRHNGSLGTMMDKCGLINAIKELNDGGS